MFRYAQPRWWAAGLAIASAVMVFLTTAAAAAETVTPSQVIDSFEGTFGVHPGQRRNHTKATCAVGQFVGTPAAAAFSRALLFTQTPIPVVARFSVAGGNPSVADATKNARRMVREFRLPDGSRQHMTMLNTQAFVQASFDNWRSGTGRGKQTSSKRSLFLTRETSTTFG